MNATHDDAPAGTDELDDFRLDGPGATDERVAAWREWLARQRQEMP